MNLRLYLIPGLALALLSCTTNPQDNSGDFSGAGQIQLTIAIPASIQSTIDQALVTITAEDILTIQQALTVQDTVASGVIVDIPAGPNRICTVDLYAMGGIHAYTGVDSVDIHGNQSMTLEISLQELTGTAFITAIIPGIHVFDDFTGTELDTSVWHTAAGGEALNHLHEITVADTLQFRMTGGAPGASYAIFCTNKQEYTRAITWSFDFKLIGRGTTSNLLEVRFSDVFSSPQTTFAFGLWSGSTSGYTGQGGDLTSEGTMEFRYEGGQIKYYLDDVLIDQRSVTFTNAPYIMIGPTLGAGVSNFLNIDIDNLLVEIQ